MRAWSYPSLPDLGQTLLQRMMSAPRQPDMLCCSLRVAGAVAVRAWLSTYFRLRIDGRERLPLERSFVMVCNHASHLDALCLLSALPLSELHRAYPAAAADYFFQSVPRGILSGIFMNALPFNRKGSCRQTLETCRRMLLRDRSILILFPEGTRSATGEMGRFKPGIGQVLAGTDVPVVPCHLAGAFSAWPRGAIVPRPRKLRLTIGAPMVFPHQERTRDSADRIAGQLEQAVHRLGGAEARDSFGGTVGVEQLDCQELTKTS